MSCTMHNCNMYLVFVHQSNVFFSIVKIVCWKITKIDSFQMIARDPWININFMVNWRKLHTFPSIIYRFLRKKSGRERKKMSNRGYIGRVAFGSADIQFRNWKSLSIRLSGKFYYTQCVERENWINVTESGYKTKYTYVYPTVLYLPP